MFRANSLEVSDFDRTLGSTVLYSTAVQPTEETLTSSAPVDPPQPDPAVRKRGLCLMAAYISVYLELSM